jgi:hypothetical protein
MRNTYIVYDGEQAVQRVESLLRMRNTYIVYDGEQAVGGEGARGGLGQLQFHRLHVHPEPRPSKINVGFVRQKRRKRMPTFA